MKKELIYEISKQLNIPQVNDSTGICRAIYSISGKMAIVSLRECSVDNFISIQHLKKRVSQIIDAYINIFPQIKIRFSSDRDSVVEDIYEIYRRNGFCYHSSYRLYPAVSKISGNGKCILYRGTSPVEKMYMSGLGFYIVKQNDKEYKSISDMFGLQTQSLSEYLKEVLEYNNEWTNIEWPDNTEFLRIKAPFSKGYWQDKPVKSEKVSLARYGYPRKIYVFYRYINGCFQAKQIPEWRVSDFRADNKPDYGEYRRIANAILEDNQQLPPIRVVKKDGVVEIKLGYRLPPTEEDFFKLYSWPVNYNNASSNFQREMAIDVYPIFKHQVELMGYCIMEE